MATDHPAPEHERTVLVDALGAIAAVDDHERADLARLDAVARSADPWGRGTPLHLTGSAFVVHPPTRRVLLRWHERQQAWLQVGAHPDPGETDPLAIARREAREETGLVDLVPWPDPARAALIHAVIVDVPASRSEAAHQHGDLRYVLATAEPDAIVAETPSAALRWLSVDAAIELSSEANVRRSLERIAALFADPGSTGVLVV